MDTLSLEDREDIRFALAYVAQINRDQVNQLNTNAQYEFIKRSLLAQADRFEALARRVTGG